ncbi:hypothetical protein LJC31_00230 [Synergistaceae bacterium OttesenSCG-928-I11]|nr:hypothetical protein [Synergistaceae bacterium OttesenSCG-928-I11]
MEARKLKEILEIMCAPDNTDTPQESDIVTRNSGDDVADEMFIKSWIDRERR